MKANNLVGATLRVIEADDFRLLLEYDSGGGESTNKFVLVEAKSLGDDVDHGTLQISELKKS